MTVRFSPVSGRAARSPTRTARTTSTGAIWRQLHRGLHGFATKLFDNGAFLDGTFKFGRIDNEFDISSEAGRVKGDYDANMFSFSIEAGHRFHPVAGFFVEPQVEFMYGRVESVDYTASASYTVKQDAAESFIAS